MYPEVVQREGVVGRPLQHPPELRLRFLPAALPLQDRAELEPEGGVLRPLRQPLPRHRLRGGVVALFHPVAQEFVRRAGLLRVFVRQPEQDGERLRRPAGRGEHPGFERREPRRVFVAFPNLGQPRNRAVGVPGREHPVDLHDPEPQRVASPFGERPRFAERVERRPVVAEFLAGMGVTHQEVPAAGRARRSPPAGRAASGNSPAALSYSQRAKYTPPSASRAGR